MNKIILPDKFGQKTEKIYMNDVRTEKADNTDTGTFLTLLIKD